MADYAAWNNALIDHFVASRPEGEAIFLSVDEDALEFIGGMALRPPERSSAVADFESAVRKRCVDPFGRVDLSSVAQLDDEGRPTSVAFLGATVLAAYRMAAEEDAAVNIDDSDYFLRLRAILGIEGRGRPPGLLPAGVEEVLWKAWNKYLVGCGRLPTAKRGEGAWTYISYPISQTLLREGDNDSLELVFRRREADGVISRHWDQSGLSSWIRNPSNLPNRKHIREILQTADPERLEASLEAIFAVFSSIDWDAPTSEGARPTGRRPTRVTAGLYRLEDPFSGAIAYHLYPRKPHFIGDHPLQVYPETDGVPIVLRTDRPGWYVPTWPVDPAGGLSYRLDSGGIGLNELVLPQRDFWVLVRDADDEESGVLASWQNPRLAEPFLLLCRSKYFRQLEVLKEAALFKWRESRKIDVGDGDWSEFRDCMVLSHLWDEAIPMDGCEALIGELKPSVEASIAFEGGLRIPRMGAWLCGFEPRLTFYAHSSPSCTLIVTDEEGNHAFCARIDTNEAKVLPALRPGHYVCEGYVGKRCMARKAIRISDWDQLAPGIVTRPCETAVGHIVLRGAFIRDKG